MNEESGEFAVAATNAPTGGNDPMSFSVTAGTNGTAGTTIPNGGTSVMDAAQLMAGNAPRYNLAGWMLNANGTVAAGQQPQRFNGFDDLLKSTFGGIGDNGDATQGMTPGLREQYNQSVATAKAAMNRRMHGIERSQFAEAQQRFDERWAGSYQPSAPIVQPTPQQPTMGRVATDTGVTVTYNNGKQSASYEYNGTRIDIPEGMDLNDDEAMGNFIASNNEVIDWMNNGNDDEEDM